MPLPTWRCIHGNNSTSKYFSILLASPSWWFDLHTYQLLQVNAHLMWRLLILLGSWPIYLDECMTATPHKCRDHGEWWKLWYDDHDWTPAGCGAESSPAPTPLLVGHPNFMQTHGPPQQSWMPQQPLSHCSPPYTDVTGLFEHGRTANPYLQPGTETFRIWPVFQCHREPIFVHLSIFLVTSTMWPGQAH